MPLDLHEPRPQKQRAALDSFVSQLHTRRQLYDLGARRKSDNSSSVGSVEDQAPGPCVECAHAARCTSASLACAAFKLFVDKGGNERWRGAPRVASAEIYAQIYND